MNNHRLSAIDLTDPRIFAVLNERKYAGVFQFDLAVRRYADRMTFESMDDLIVLLSIARPGPMESGAADKWVKRRMGLEAVDYAHPALEPILKSTYGLLIFQEQTMQIAREIGQLSWEDVTNFRRAIGKSQGQRAMEVFKTSFLKGCFENKIDEYASARIWNDLVGFGSYGFNKSHAVAYATVAAWCCWFKAYHPTEFAAASLDAKKDPVKQIEILRELSEEGIAYVPFDPAHSDIRWTIKDNTLVGPLTQINGIGPISVREILDARKSGNQLQASLIKRLTATTTEIDTLYPIRDAIARLAPNLNTTIQPIGVKDAQCGVTGEIIVLALASKISPLDENEPQRIEKRKGKRLNGPTAALNLFMRDDTDEIFAKVNRYNFERLGREIVERGRAGKALYALKGEIWRGFRGMDVKAVKFLGFIDD